MDSKSGNSPRLVIIEGKDKGKVIPLKNGTIVIGRSKGDILVQDPRVSRSHAAFHFDEKTGKVTFSDLKSLNGTLLNGSQSEEGPLNDGDKVQLGNTLFDIQISGEAASVAEVENAAGSPQIIEQPAITKEPEGLQLDESPLQKLEVPTRLAEEKTNVGTSDEKPPEKPVRPRSPRKFPSFPRRLKNLGVTALLVVGLMWGYQKFGGPGKPSVSPQLSQIMEKAQSLQKEGKLEEAIKLAEEALDKSPDVSDFYMLLGNLYAEAKKNELAVKAYMRAKDFPPVQQLIPVRLIGLYLKQNQTKEAEEQLKEVDRMIKAGIHSKELFIEAAQLFLEFRELKQPPQKTIVLAKALQTELAPESSIGYKLEAQVLFQENRIEEAMEMLKKGLSIEPQDEWLMENIAFAKLSMKDVASAAEMVENWIKLRPTATKPLLVMAYLKFNERNLPAALPYVQKILQIGATIPNDPHLPEALDLMGQIYSQQKQPEEALNFFKQSCQAGFQQACDNELMRNQASTDSTNSSKNDTPPPSKE